VRKRHHATSLLRSGIDDQAIFTAEVKSPAQCKKHALPSAHFMISGAMERPLSLHEQQSLPMFPSMTNDQ
jgi:hypothetical protein